MRKSIHVSNPLVLFEALAHDKWALVSKHFRCLDDVGCHPEKWDCLCGSALSTVIGG